MSKAQFYVRYFLARWTMTFGLWIMPRGRYHTELRKAIYDVKHRAMLEVAVHRAHKEATEDPQTER